MYMEDLKHALKFMSATGADDVYDAAIRRAGMLQVPSTEDLFDAVQTLAHVPPSGGERLAILTNGGGPGVMATDELVCNGGTLGALAAATPWRRRAPCSPMPAFQPSILRKTRYMLLCR